MDSSHVLLISVLLAVFVGAVIVLRRARNKRRTSKREGLRQRLRNITFHDNGKIERLIEFERDELKRKGRPEEAIEELMSRAIERWERDNAAAASIY